MNSVGNLTCISTEKFTPTLLSILEKRFEEKSMAITIYCIIVICSCLIALFVDCGIRGNIHRNIVKKVNQLSGNVSAFFLINNNPELEAETARLLENLEKNIEGKYYISEVVKKIREISESLGSQGSENNSEQTPSSHGGEHVLDETNNYPIAEYVAEEKAASQIRESQGPENNSNQTVPIREEIIDIDQEVGSDSDSDSDSNEYLL